MAATSIVSGGGFSFSKQSVGGTWTWKVRTDNTIGVGQQHYVEDINTPFGPLSVTDIPIPGDVIEEMACSVTDVQNQLAPLLTLVPGSTTAFNITVTEGDSNAAVGSVTVQNSGAFGSFMTATATPSVPWLEANPASFNGVGKNQQATFDISILPGSLLATGSPYSGVINLQDSRTPPTIIPINVTATVLPKPTILLSPTAIALSFLSATNVPGGAQQLTVTNTGPVLSSLEFTVSKLNNTSPWMDFTPTSGGPLTTGASDIITISVVAAEAAKLLPGAYTDTLRIASTNASNTPQDIVVTLTVS